MQQEYGGTAERIARETAAGVESNISDVLNRSAGIATESAFAKYKQGLLKFYDVLQEGGAEKIAGGISATTGGIFDAIEKTIGAAKSGNIKQLGLDMMSGAVDGVKAGAKSLYQSTVGAVQQAYEGAEAYNESRSPSERYKRLGKWAIQGYAIGLLNDKDKVKKTMREVLSSDQLEKIIQENAKRTGLDPNLIRAVIGQESSGHPGAISPKGARGLMQLMPATAARFGVTDIHDPQQNVRGGTDYLKFLKDLFGGNVPLMLAGYNAGEGAVQKYGGIPPYRETQDYVRKISANYAKMNASGGFGQADSMSELREENKIAFEHAFKGWLDTTSGHDAVVQFNIAQLDFWEKVYKEQQPLRKRDFAGEGVATGHNGWSRGTPLPVEVINIGNVAQFNKDFHEGNIEGFGNDGASLQPFKGSISTERAQDVLALFKLARGEAIETSNELSHLSLEITPRALESVKAVAASTEDAFGNLPPLIKASGDEAKQLAQTNKEIASIFGNAFEQGFSGKGLRGAWASLRSDFKSMLIGMGKDAVESKVFKFLSGNKDAASGAGGGGGGILSSLFGGIKGLFGGSRSATSTVPFAGGAIPIGSPASVASTVLSSAGGLAPVIPGAITAAQTAAMTGGVAAAGGLAAGIGGGAAAGGSAAAAGGAGGSALFGGLSLAKLGAFASNPITLAVAGAAIGGFLLYKHFSHRTEKALQKAIKDTYGVDVRDMKTLTQIKLLGEQTFGKGNVGKHLMETIKLDSVKEVIRGYAERTGQDASKITTNAQFGDETFKGNQFITPLATPSAPVVPVGGAGAGQGTSGASGQAASGASGLLAPLLAALNRSNETHAKLAESHAMLAESHAMLTEKITAMRPGDVVAAGAQENPEAIGRANNTALRSGTVRQAQQEALGMRN